MDTTRIVVDGAPAAFSGAGGGGGTDTRVESAIGGVQA